MWTGKRSVVGAGRVLCVLLLVVVSVIVRVEGAVCPSSTPSPSNPVGCVLYSFPSAVASPSTVAVDTFANPTTLIVGSTLFSSISIHFLNGTFFKSLIAPPDHPFAMSDSSAVDSNGIVFSLQSGEYIGPGYVLMFTAYPNYRYFSVITELNDPVNDGLAIDASSCKGSSSTSPPAPTSSSTASPATPRALPAPLWWDKPRHPQAPSTAQCQTQ